MAFDQDAYRQRRQDLYHKAMAAEEEHLISLMEPETAQRCRAARTEADRIRQEFWDKMGWIPNDPGPAPFDGFQVAKDSGALDMISVQLKIIDECKATVRKR